MSFAGLLTTPGRLFVYTAGVADVYGDPSGEYAAVAISCHIARPSSTENAENVTDTDLTLYFDPSADISSSSVIEVQGAQWEVQGEPSRSVNPRTGAVTASAKIRKRAA